jgi:hypothetical protein
MKSLSFLYEIILLLAFLVTNCYGQIDLKERKGDVKGILIGFSGGTELVNNSNLNHWLTANGVSVSNSFSFCYSIKTLVLPRKTVLGFEIGQSILGSSQKVSFFSFLVGMSLRKNSLNIVPLLGIGSNTLIEKFNDSIPQILYQTKLSNGKLFKDRFFLDPQVIFFKKENKKSPDIFSLTIGCRIFFWQGDWRYIGDNGKMIENSIPNLSAFNPYISICYGFGAWRIK